MVKLYYEIIDEYIAYRRKSMNKEVISDTQGIILITMFIIGSSVVIGTGAEAGRDSWMTIILGMIVAFPVILLYSRVHYLFPGKDLFDIMEIVFGKFLGKVLSLVYIWFSFHLGALVIRNFGEFINTVSIPETPEIVAMIIIGLLCGYGIKVGLEVLGRWGQLAFLFILGLLFITVPLLVPAMNWRNFLPIMGKGITPVLKGTFAVFAFPFAEIVIFTLVFSSFRSRKSPYKVYAWGLLWGGLILLTTTLSDIAVLGERQIGSIYFPAYSVVSRMNIMDFIQRTEVVVSIGFLASGFIKVSICLLGACRGIAKVIGNNDYRFMVTPVSLLMIILSYIIYDSMLEMIEWAFTTWTVYAFLFQVILPVIIWIGAEIKKKSLEKEKYKKG